MIQKTYNDMWAIFCSALEKGQCEIDQNIGNKNDTRRGITALAYLESNNKSVVNEIDHFLNQVQQIEPEQYYHPINELHLTILSIITCIAGFKLTDINPTEYERIFNQVFNGIGSIEIELKGITASSSCVVIQGFPVDSSLAILRDRLRKNFKESGLRSSIDSRYKITTAHVSVIRFHTEIKDKDKLKILFKKYRNYSFGTVKLTKIELVFNNWYQNLSITEKLANYSI